MLLLMQKKLGSCMHASGCANPLQKKNIYLSDQINAIYAKL